MLFRWERGHLAPYTRDMRGAFVSSALGGVMCRWETVEDSPPERSGRPVCVCVCVGVAVGPGPLWGSAPCLSGLEQEAVLCRHGRLGQEVKGTAWWAVNEAAQA